MKYLEIKANGQKNYLEKDLNLKLMQEHVGGYIEMIPLRGSEMLYMALNEDGRCLDLLWNQEASKIAPCSALGDVIVVKVNSEGDNTSLTDSDVKWLNERLK